MENVIKDKSPVCFVLKIFITCGRKEITHKMPAHNPVIKTGVFNLFSPLFNIYNKLPPKNVKQGSLVNISIQIKNIGKREGKEVIQLYIHDKESSFTRPNKELKGFKKVSLKPGESKIVKFVMNQRDLSYYDPYKAEWVAEPGEFEVMIGSSSRNIQAKKIFKLV